MPGSRSVISEKSGQERGKRRLSPAPRGFFAISLLSLSLEQTDGRRSVLTLMWCDAVLGASLGLPSFDYSSFRGLSSLGPYLCRLLHETKSAVLDGNFII